MKFGGQCNLVLRSRYILNTTKTNIQFQMDTVIVQKNAKL